MATLSSLIGTYATPDNWPDIRQLPRFVEDFRVISTRRVAHTREGDGVLPCLLLILFAAFPRVALVLLFLFSNYLQRAYHGLIVPILGFVFLLLTTLAYAWMSNSGLPIAGLNLILLISAVLIDVGSWGRGEYHRRTRW